MSWKLSILGIVLFLGVYTSFHFNGKLIDERDEAFELLTKTNLQVERYKKLVERATRQTEKVVKLSYDALAVCRKKD